MKKCYKCKFEKEEKEFKSQYYKKQNKTYITNMCKKCANLCSRAYFKTEKGKSAQKKNVKKWISKNREKWNKYQMVSKRKNFYKISEIDYENLILKQNNLCAICGYTQIEKNRFFPCIDHDHSTGKVRGILCSACNKGLGYFKDNISYLENAIKYLNIQNT